MEQMGGEITLQEIKTEALLENILRLNCRTTYNGDYNAVDKLLDLEVAMEEAKLTDKQREVLQVVYVLGYDTEDHERDDAGDYLGISTRAVRYRLDGALKKIAKVYANWEEHDDEIQQT